MCAERIRHACVRDSVIFGTGGRDAVSICMGLYRSLGGLESSIIISDLKQYNLGAIIPFLDPRWESFSISGALKLEPIILYC